MIKLIIFDLWNTLAKIHGKSTTEGIIRVLNLEMEKEKCRKIYEQSFQTKNIILNLKHIDNCVLILESNPMKN
jgi:FMN phosphatase YigB (HAD superfamily)